jgi:CSLREA domain-containing protein
LPVLVATLLVAGGVLVVGARPAEAATFTVTKIGDGDDRNRSDARCDTSTNNGSQCTLRAAIEEANDTAGADTVDFDTGGGAKTIKPASGLPTITDAVTIDGYTQRGARPNTLAGGNDAVLKVKLNGSDAGTNADGLEISTSNSTIRGLVIDRFDDDGFVISGSDAMGNRVEGNFVGTNI